MDALPAVKDITEFTFKSSEAAHAARRELIVQDHRVSLIGFDPSRDLYTFDDYGKAKPAEVTVRSTELPDTMTVDEKKHYRLGWKYSGKVGSIYEGMDDAEASYERHNQPSKEQWNRWMDGYLDCAAGRDFAHIPNCPGHADNECGEA